MTTKLTEILDKLITDNNKENRQQYLFELSDLIEFELTEDEQLKQVIEKLTLLLVKESDWELRAPIFKNLQLAFYKGEELEKVDLSPILTELSTKEEDIDYLDMVLLITSLTYNRKYTELFEKYQKHSYETIRERAQECLERLNQLE